MEIWITVKDSRVKKGLQHILWQRMTLHRPVQLHICHAMFFLVSPYNVVNYSFTNQICWNSDMDLKIFFCFNRKNTSYEVIKNYFFWGRDIISYFIRLIYFTSSVIKHKLKILAYYPNTLNADNFRQKNECIAPAYLFLSKEAASATTR